MLACTHVCKMEMSVALTNWTRISVQLLTAIITVALAIIITIINLDTFPTSNPFPSFDVFLQKYVSAQPCGGLLQTGQGEVHSSIREAWRVGGACC